MSNGPSRLWMLEAFHAWSEEVDAFAVAVKVESFNQRVMLTTQANQKTAAVLEFLNWCDATGRTPDAECYEDRDAEMRGSIGPDDAKDKFVVLGGDVLPVLDGPDCGRDVDDSHLPCRREDGHGGPCSTYETT